MGGSDGYSNHKCNGFKAEEQSGRASAVQEVARFNFYRKRQETYALAAVLEGKMRGTLDDARLAFTDEVTRRGDAYRGPTTGVLDEALDTLLSCRETLAHSYVFGFFREKAVKHMSQLLFEDAQFQLECATRKLAAMLGKKQRALEKSLDSDTGGNVFTPEKSARGARPTLAAGQEPPKGLQGVGISLRTLPPPTWNDAAELVDNATAIAETRRYAEHWGRNLVSFILSATGEGHGSTSGNIGSPPY